MRLVEIKKVLPGRFVTRYDLVYVTSDNKTKVYEMLSRRNNISSHEDLRSSKTDAVVLVMHNKDKSKILLNYEYRMAVGESVYNFPAGLIDKDETALEAARRELFEETGLNLCEIETVWPESYSSVGVSNEKSLCVIGKADGEFKLSTSTEEEISAHWFSKEEVKELLKKKPFASRTQCYCQIWANS